MTELAGVGISVYPTGWTMGELKVKKIIQAKKRSDCHKRSNMFPDRCNVLYYFQFISPFVSGLS